MPQIQVGSQIINCGLAKTRVLWSVTKNFISTNLLHWLMLMARMKPYSGRSKLGVIHITANAIFATFAKIDHKWEHWLHLYVHTQVQTWLGLVLALVQLRKLPFLCTLVRYLKKVIWISQCLIRHTRVTLLSGTVLFRRLVMCFYVIKRLKIYTRYA